jgi:two-component system, response regulator, stage 0 sporulation protein F
MREPARRDRLDSRTEDPCRLVIGEDDHEIRIAMAGLLVEGGFEVSHLADGNAVVDHLYECVEVRRLPHLLVLDHRMPGRTGLEVLDALREVKLAIPVIMLTAFGSDIRPAARMLGAWAILDKPFDPDDLLTAVYYLTRGAERVPTARTGEFSAPVCAACASSRRVRLDPRMASVLFCADCWELAGPPGALDDLGEAD